MALNANEQVSTATYSPKSRIVAKSVRPKNFAAGSGTIAKLTPLAFNTSTNLWVPWKQTVTSEVSTLVGTGTISGGNYTITVNGETTAAIAHSANAATIQAALEALGGIDQGDVTVTGGPMSTNTNAVLTWGGKWAGVNMAVSVTSSVTGGGSVAVTETTAGANPNGVNVIKGFAFEDIVLNASDEVIGNVLMRGDIHFDDIPIISGNDANGLKAALRTGGVRQLGFDIQGLTQFR